MNVLPISDTLLNNLDDISPFTVDLLMSDMNPILNQLDNISPFNADLIMSDMNQNNSINDLFLPQSNSSSNCLKYILIAIIIFLIVRLCMKYKKDSEDYRMLDTVWYNTDTNPCCGTGCGYVPDPETTDLASTSLPYKNKDLIRNKQMYNGKLMPNSYTSYGGGYQCIPKNQ